MAFDLRTFTYVDVLQDQVASFLATVSQGYHPLPGQACLFMEVSPGMDVNRVTDICLKQTSCTVGMMVVERRYGALELHHDDQGQVREAGDRVLAELDLKLEDRLKPRVVSEERITGIEPYHAAITNRMRHGNFQIPGQTLYILETYPAGYAVIAANEAEKAADIDVLEIRAFGAFGRVYLGGDDAQIRQAAEAATAVLREMSGREEKR